MFRMRLSNGTLTHALADAVQTGAVRHVCCTGQYDRVLVNAEGEHLARARARTLTINLLYEAQASRPTFPGTWVRLGG